MTRLEKEAEEAQRTVERERLRAANRKDTVRPPPRPRNQTTTTTKGKK